MIRVKNEMFRHIEELTNKNERQQEENKELRAENQKLRTENASLRQRIKKLELTYEQRITTTIEQALERATKPLYERIGKLEEENSRKDTEIQRLKAQINKDSSNSSKPPSSNGFKKIPNNREVSGRKPGGQPGYKGHTLTIPSDLEELAKNGKVQHEIIDETGGAKGSVSDWTIDLKIIPIYTERRRPAGSPPSIRYGTEVQALSVYLQNIGMMSLERVSEFFEAATGGLISLSEATILSFSRNVAEKIDVEPLIENLLNDEILHTDDTPVKTTQRQELGAPEVETAKHTTFSACVRTYSNATTTLLTVNAHKDEEGVKHDNILTRFFGILSHDHEAKFYNYGTKHATCGAHLSRELKGISELCMISWAGRVRSFFLSMNKKKNEGLSRNETCCDPEVLLEYEAVYDALVEEGAVYLAGMKAKTIGFDELRRMVNRLRAFKDAYLLFIRDYTAPFTNNQSERDLRHCKTKQKVSGCYRAWRGLLDYCKIRSLTDTATKRGLNVLAAIRSSALLC
jgi:transposase